MTYNEPSAAAAAVSGTGMWRTKNLTAKRLSQPFRFIRWWRASAESKGMPGKAKTFVRLSKSGDGHASDSTVDALNDRTAAGEKENAESHDSKSSPLLAINARQDLDGSEAVDDAATSGKPSSQDPFHSADENIEEKDEGSNEPKKCRNDISRPPTLEADEDGSTRKTPHDNHPLPSFVESPSLTIAISGISSPTGEVSFDLATIASKSSLVQTRHDADGVEESHLQADDNDDDDGHFSVQSLKTSESLSSEALGILAGSKIFHDYTKNGKQKLHVVKYRLEVASSNDSSRSQLIAASEPTARGKELQQHTTEMVRSESKRSNNTNGIFALEELVVPASCSSVTDITEPSFFRSPAEYWPSTAEALPRSLSAGSSHASPPPAISPLEIVRTNTREEDGAEEPESRTLSVHKRISVPTKIRAFDLLHLAASPVAPSLSPLEVTRMNNTECMSYQIDPAACPLVEDEREPHHVTSTVGQKTLKDDRDSHAASEMSVVSFDDPAWSFSGANLEDIEKVDRKQLHKWASWSTVTKSAFTDDVGADKSGRSSFDWSAWTDDNESKASVHRSLLRGNPSSVLFHSPPVQSLRSIPRVRSSMRSQLFFSHEELNQLEEDRGSTEHANHIETVAVFPSDKGSTNTSSSLSSRNRPKKAVRILKQVQLYAQGR